jgi:DNA repair protein RAD51/nuclear pore complex protein Nup160
MASTEVSYLYKEARLNLEPAFPGSTLHFTLPSSTTSTFGARTPTKRTIVHDKYIDKDEDAFARSYLASEASIYFRKKHQYPRSFLWRILDDRKVLEIQSIDFDQDYDHQSEAHLTLQLQFPSPIRPFGIAFDEPDDRDALTVFVVTQSKELYTLNLLRDFFIREKSTEGDIEDWCKIFSPASFRIRDPYRLVAVSDRDLFVSMQDGGIQRLTRKHGDDGSIWQDIGFRKDNWSLKSLVTWGGNNSVRFNNTDLDGSAAAAIALSPEKDYILSVCLDHVLRVWNAETGKLGLQEDLLRDHEKLPDKASQYFIGPSQPMLMQILNFQGVGMDGVQFHVATYSPKKHQFKFWGIRTLEDTLNGIKDVQGDLTFIPPVDELMNTTVWNLEEFYIKAEAGWKNTELWIRARSGPSSKIYSLKFNLEDNDEALAYAWKHHWISVDSGPLTIEGLKSNPTNPGELDSLAPTAHQTGVTEQWLNFLLYPGRFTTASLETALLVYKKGLGQKQAAGISNKAPFKDRLCAIVASYVALGRQNASKVDYEEHEVSLMAQWQMYYGLVRDLHKRRGEVLSLVFDYGYDMPWLLLSDYASAIRKGCEVDILHSNQHILRTAEGLPTPLQTALHDPESQDVARLLSAASQFRKGLGSSFQHQFQAVITNEMLQSSLLAIPARIEGIEQSCKLCDQIADEDVTKLSDALGMDFVDLDNSLIMKAVEKLSQGEQGRGIPKKQVTQYGLKVVSRIAQETLETSIDILLDLMVLIIFMHVDIDIDDRSEGFSAAELFQEILDQLKDNSVLMWMACTFWSHPAPTGPSHEHTLRSLSEISSSGQPAISQTVLEGICGHKTFGFPMPKGPQSEVLTYWARMWTSEPFRSSEYEHVVNDTLGILIQEKDVDLASNFLKFVPQNNWSTYLNARLCLLKGEYTLAAIYFKKSSFKLGKFKKNYAELIKTNKFPAIGIFNIDDSDSINLTSPDERDLFSDGLPNYYLHVLSLFEKAKAHAFVADFAKLGLQSLTGDEPQFVKTELLSRLFNASIQTSRFEEAYTALVRHTDVSL